MIHLFLCVTCLFVCLFVSLCIVLFRHSSVYDIGSLFSTRTGSKHEVYIVLYCILLYRFLLSSVHRYLRSFCFLLLKYSIALSLFVCVSFCLTTQIAIIPGIIVIVIVFITEDVVVLIHHRCHRRG